MRNGYLSALNSLAEINEGILALVADNGAIVYDKFRADFPGRFLNFGISEANMVSVAAGLASCGKIPFAYTIANFLTMRAYEQVRIDVCLQNQNVKLVGVGGGIAYSALGPTHHAIEDIAIMRVLPNMTVLVPASPLEAKKATFAAAKVEGPVYIRLESTKEPEVYAADYLFEVGKGVTLREGEDITLIATGSIVYDTLLAADQLHREGISARVINMHTLKPIDCELIVQAASETGAILTIEEHNVIGGLGSAVADVLMEEGQNNAVFGKMGFQDRFCKGYGTHDQLKKNHGLAVEDMVNKARNLLQTKLYREGKPVLTGLKSAAGEK